MTAVVVLDTSALLYWTLDPQKLTQPAAEAIDAAEQIVVSAISLWEVGLKVKRGKLEIPVSIEVFAKRLAQVDRVEIVPVETETWLKNLELAWDHRDPADRTIVATAVLRQATLITSDVAMRGFYVQAVW